ncbi:hypothetical protein NMY22_g3058 [Coprinellus aureogranulatus]|nr:hypothetical protein NMY22_g3058 [Coprinellus aureogranulatus]
MRRFGLENPELTPVDEDKKAKSTSDTASAPAPAEPRVALEPHGISLCENGKMMLNHQYEMVDHPPRPSGKNFWLIWDWHYRRLQIALGQTGSEEWRKYITDIVRLDREMCPLEKGAVGLERVDAMLAPPSSGRASGMPQQGVPLRLWAGKYGRLFVGLFVAKQSAIFCCSLSYRGLRPLVVKVHAGLKVCEGWKQWLEAEDRAILGCPAKFSFHLSMKVSLSASVQWFIEFLLTFDLLFPPLRPDHGCMGRLPKPCSSKLHAYRTILLAKGMKETDSFSLSAKIPATAIFANIELERAPTPYSIPTLDGSCAPAMGSSVYLRPRSPIASASAIRRAVTFISAATHLQQPSSSLPYESPAPSGHTLRTRTAYGRLRSDEESCYRALPCSPHAVLERAVAVLDRLTYREAGGGVHPPRTTVHLSKSRLPQLFVSSENEFVSELNWRWAYSLLFHIFKWLWALMLNRLGGRVVIEFFFAPKPLPSPPETYNIPEQTPSNPGGKEGPRTPLADSSAAESSHAGGSADNPSSASPVILTDLTPADLEQAPIAGASDDQKKPAIRPKVNARYYLTDVQIERIDSAKEGLLPLSLTELRVSSKPGEGSEEETVFTLSRISLNRWELTECIAFPDAVEGVQCILKGSEGEDVASVYLSSGEIARSGQAGDRSGTDMRPKTCSGGVCLIFWSNVIDLAPESVLPAMVTRDSIDPSGSDDEHSSTDVSLPALVAKVVREGPEKVQRMRMNGDNSLADGITAVLDSAAELMRLFEATGDFTHVEEAAAMLEAGQQAVRESTPDENALQEAEDLRKRGEELSKRFKATGDLDLVAEAVTVKKRVLQLVPEGHESVPWSLHNLSYSLSITLMPDGDKDLPIGLNSLGVLLMIRFGRTGDPSDLDEGLSVHQRAVQLGPEDDPHLPGRLNGLGDAFKNHFGLTGDPSDLDAAISAQRRAVSLTPEGHEHLPALLNNLGICLRERYQTSSSLSDLNEAISAQQRSVQLIPEGHPGLPALFSNFGKSLLERFTHTFDLSDIAQGVSAQERAVDLTPESHAHCPLYLANLGKTLHTQHLATGSYDALSRSLSLFKLAATCTSGTPKYRLGAAKEWIEVLTQHDSQSTDILVAFGVALGLITLIGGLEQTVQGRHLQLRDLSGIALESASAAFALDRVDRALEWLEQGRCLVWNQLNNLRTPVDSLHVHDRQLAVRVMEVSKQLENAGSSRQHSSSATSLQGKASLEDEALEHVKLAKEWDRLLGEVRSKPGFENFLQPPTCSTLLQNLPDSGAVVVINVDKKRCDAIALMAGLDEPLHIPLPNFSWERRLSIARTCNTASKWMASVPRLRDVLRGLWVDVVKPILGAMAFTKLDSTRDGPAPRIWWCPTGPLSFLPLHAAGIYEGPSPENVLDYAVSSYTPTVTTLTDRIRNNRPIDKSASGLFLTCQPNGIPRSPIPGTVEEVDSIVCKAVEKKVRVLKLAGSEVSGEDCLKHMEDYSSVHLACHASQDTIQPLQSRFFFHKGSLELSNILKRNMRNADLAFLSACKTSVGEEKLADEAVHLAAGMLAAGYRRVIATMWSINDEKATKVAKSFYQYLWEHPTDASRDGGFDGTLSAYALHHAIQELRRQIGDSEDSILAWAPFIHYGY